MSLIFLQNFTATFNCPAVKEAGGRTFVEKIKIIRNVNTLEILKILGRLKSVLLRGE